LSDVHGTTGYSGRAIAIFLVASTCAIAALTVRWDRTRTKVGAFYEIAPRLGGLAPVGLSDKGKTTHYRVAFQGPRIFAVRRMTSRGGPLPLFDDGDRWAWFLEPHRVCADCDGPTLYGAVMHYEGDTITRVEFRDVDGEAAQSYTVERDGEAYRLTHSKPSPDRGLSAETHYYDPFDRIRELHFDGGQVSYVRDDQGRVIEEQITGRSPRTLRYTYAEPRHPARPTEVTSDRPDDYGCHRVQTDWDSIGHPVKIRCLDASGTPTASTTGCTSFDILWDDENWTTACLDAREEPIASRAGWTFLRVVLDEMAYPAGIVGLDAQGDEVPIDAGASRFRIDRDDRGQIERYTRYAPSGEPL